MSGWVPTGVAAVVLGCLMGLIALAVRWLENVIVERRERKRRVDAALARLERCRERTS